ncbi:hypothetical protein P7C71_g3884, partial [Lecanoromycetidae sp. Uapishka_2]
MALDNGNPFVAQALPTPTDTPYETPTRGILGQSSWHGSSPPYSNSSPAPFPEAEDSYFPKQHDTADAGDDKRYSTHDPRRLTPNLGISFVSQIHSLKKDLEGKDVLVESLEDSLHQAKTENEQLVDELKSQKVEVKSIRNQMQSLEQDMLQALEDMARQRDNAVESVAETRKRLEVSKKKVRSQDEEVNKSQELWETERQAWEDKKQKLESKVHVVEERLKTMVAEMLAVRSTGENRPGGDDHMDDSMRDAWNVKGTDTWNNRTSSRQSNRSLDRTTSRQSNWSLNDTHEGKEPANFRASRLSGLHAQGGSNMSGLSLAEELEIDEDEEDEAEVEVGDHGMISPDALPEEYETIIRYSKDEKARKIMGIHSDKMGQKIGDDISHQGSMDIIDDYYNFPRRHSGVPYVDASTQFTPHSSPVLEPQQLDFASEKPVEQIERAANQSRKRVAISQIFVEQTSLPKQETPKAPCMTSTGCQTVERPLQPPMPSEVNSQSSSVMKSASTQTSEDTLHVSKPAGSRLASLPLDVPVIAIHPPASRPPSSHNSVVLPPRTKNAACQVDIQMPKSLRSTAMQTEEIRIDRRPIRIPPRLQQSVFSPPIPARSSERRSHVSQMAHDPANPPPIRKVRSPPPTINDQEVPRPSSPEIRDAYPGNNDNGPLDSKQRSGPRRPIRSESIFAGFEDANDVKFHEIQSDLSDDDDFATVAPIRKTLSKVQNSWKLVPQAQNSILGKSESASDEIRDQQRNDTRDVGEVSHTKAKVLPKSTSKSFQTKPPEGSRRVLGNSKEADIRRKALVANGVAEHTRRARSPSAPDLPGKKPTTVAPPFPVPTRASSRKIPISASDGAGSPTPYTTSFFTARRAQESGRPPTKRKILRKTQSAAAVVKQPTRRPPPPPPMSASSTVPASPKSSVPSRNQFVLPYDSVAELPKQLSRVSRPQSRGSATIESPGQQTSVVDAIAQTMVGEWMWKYVRKRTSFGITETPQAEFEMGRNGEAGNSSGARHKRWVWLAPYESAVIWSSKQPTSGPALLGKGGRKLTIQSVLDVKDDTPLPRNANSQSAYDRSILILTPERALKFTAISRERHYIWLTALSFLSHSGQGMDDLANPPPLPSHEYQPPSSQASASGFRRTPARDSLTLSKTKPRPSLGGHSYSTPPGELERDILHETRMAVADDAGAFSEDAAEPPQVPRTAAHARKRSSTGPRPVPLSAFHSYPSNSMAMSSSFSVQNPTSRDKYDRYMPSVPNSTQNTMSRRTTDSLIAPVVPDNFFDPIGTVRMEAFVDKGPDYVTEVTKKKEGRSYRTRRGRKKDLSYWGVDESMDSSGLGGLRLRSDDPFTGF